MLLGNFPASKYQNAEESLSESDTEIDDATVGGTHEQTEPFKIFFKWLIDGGAQFPLLSLHFCSSVNRAINSKRIIQPDEDVLFVPYSHLMTTEIALASKVGKQIIESGVEISSLHTYLASYLLQEKANPKSYWKPYIDILPKSHDTIPLFFNEKQLAELKGSMTVNQIQELHISLRAEYDSLVKHVPMYAEFLYKDFVWARLVVITRIFGMVIDRKSTEGLVPMADMLNHKIPKDTYWTYVPSRIGFVIKARNVIGKGCEVFNSYGRKCNSIYFLDYGFVPEENEDNEAVMWFELGENDPTKNLKCRVSGLSSNLNYLKKFQMSQQYKSPDYKVRHAFSYVRFLAATKEELDEFFDKDDFCITNIPPVSFENENRVLKMFAAAAQKALHGFSHSFAHDQTLLADLDKYPLFSNARNIVLMRSGEKRVLQYYINLYKLVGPIMKQLGQDSSVTKVASGILDENMKIYFTSVMNYLDDQAIVHQKVSE